MWAHQNGILHNLEQAKTDVLEKGVNEQIGQIYKTSSQALPRDTLSLLHQPKETILKLPLVAKQQWIESA